MIENKMYTVIVIIVRVFDYWKLTNRIKSEQILIISIRMMIYSDDLAFFTAQEIKLSLERITIILIVLSLSYLHIISFISHTIFDLTLLQF